MLAIDDLKKLAEMQALLLKRTSNDREVNLEKYKKIVIQVDEYSFSELLSELNQVNDHNQTLEDELQFLEQVRSSYQQLLEQQLGFKRVCELYGDDGLQLSNLSQVNIEYIDSRISAINGYLINRKNLEDKKNKIEKLNQELIAAEKNKLLLNKRLSEFEEILRKNFINAEGRIIVDGDLRFTSVISEYKEVGFDFKQLLEDMNSFKQSFAKVNEEAKCVEEKLKAAKRCYEYDPSGENKQIIDGIIHKEYLDVNYRLTLLKIVELLLTECNEYVSFKSKRNVLLNLIKNRYDYLIKLGICFSIDPFNMTKVSEQLDMISSLRDNSKDISKIRGEIAELSDILDMMSSKNNEYMLQLSDTKSLIISRLTINDIDTSVVSWAAEDYFVEKKVEDNQVVDIKEVPEQFNVLVVRQKTRGVVRRVYEMVSSNSLAMEIKEVEELTPELVIVHPPMVDVVEEGMVLDEVKPAIEIDVVDSEDIDLFNMNDISFDIPVEDNSKQLELEDKIDVIDDLMPVISDELEEVTQLDNDTIVNDEEPVVSEAVALDSIDKDLFTIVDPFLETTMFSDRVDDDVNDEDFNKKIDDLIPDKQVIDNDILVFSNIENVIDDGVEGDNEIEEKLENEMPDAFWTVHDDDKVNLDDSNEEDDSVLSFDEQVELLRLGEDSTEFKTSKNKIKRLELNNLLDKKAA